MTNHTRPHLLRHWPRRAAVLTSAMLVLSWAASPGAHADGLLDDVTEVVGGTADQVVTPTVEAVQSAVPQPVQEAVEPAVEHVVEPVVSQVEETGKAVPGADRVVEPVVKTVEPVVKDADEAAGEPEGEPAADPVEAPATGTSDPADGDSAAPGAGTAASGQGGDASGHGGGEGAASTGRPRDGERPSGDASCTSATDLPPRGMATPLLLGLTGARGATSTRPTVWDMTNALMRSWLGDAWGSADVGSPDRRLADVPWFDDARGAARGVTIDRSGTVPVLLGLLGLLGLLVAGGALARSRQLERQAA